MFSRGVIMIQIRRPLLIILIFVIAVSFIITNKKKEDEKFNDKIITIQGTVKGRLEKPRYNQYKVGAFLINDYTRTKNLKIGQKVNITGKFKSLAKMKYEDFDYGRYIKSTGYKGIIYINSYKIIGKNKIYDLIGKVKFYINKTYRYLYKKNSDFINSILLAEVENLTDEQKEMFTRTGTSHVISISGLHTGILCVVIAFLLRGINKLYKLLILSIFISLYCIMVGASPSIIRSITFVMVFYLSVFINRKKDGISTLSLIGIVLIINNPYVIYNVSFQLSFLATFSILIFYNKINSIIKLSMVSLTISSNILTLPIIYYTFKGIPLVSIIGNLIIVPFIGIIMYLSIASLIIFKISVVIAKIIALFNSTLIEIIFFLLEKLSNLNFTYIDIDNPKLYIVVIYYIGVFFYIFYIEGKEIKEQENGLQGYYKEYKR
ncbi:ComEC/Rec2 family competence protein [Clostridioides sp. ES-S-0190-01]|nr:ComEC/Rec2 family competence protein [Clostridioides sp. ES-S-0048-02]MCC0701748.1 ComEC/Rec2 family competence protein [Clostridioides sp. ES-S-0049-02]MCC0707611.1 ComEC/Rec2 family competence protein [Clostridioides sp. ES-S-0190-01]